MEMTNEQAKKTLDNLKPFEKEYEKWRQRSKSSLIRQAVCLVVGWGGVFAGRPALMFTAVFVQLLDMLILNLYIRPRWHAALDKLGEEYSKVTGDPWRGIEHEV